MELVRTYEVVQSTRQLKNGHTHNNACHYVHGKLLLLIIKTAPALLAFDRGNKSRKDKSNDLTHQSSLYHLYNENSSN